MHITITTFEYPEGKLAEVEAFCQSIADKVKKLGSSTSLLVDMGDGQAANISIYKDEATADRAAQGAMALYEAAGKAGLLKPRTVHRRKGDVLFDYLS